MRTALTIGLCAVALLCSCSSGLKETDTVKEKDVANIEYVDITEVTENNFIDGLEYSLTDEEVSEFSSRLIDSKLKLFNTSVDHWSNGYVLEVYDSNEEDLFTMFLGNISGYGSNNALFLYNNEALYSVKNENLQDFIEGIISDNPVNSDENQQTAETTLKY